jgi:transcriptional regulator with XRE-family HTH domain
MINGLKLKNARIKKGLKQEDLSKIIGVHQTAISQYEKGKRNPSALVLEKICEMLCIKNYKEETTVSILKNKINNLSYYEACEVIKFVDYLNWKRTKQRKGIQ